MDDKLAIELDEMIGALTGFIATLRKQGLRDAAQILSVSKLDLQMRRHCIEQHEVRAVCKMLQGQVDLLGPAATLSARRPRFIRLERRQRH